MATWLAGLCKVISIRNYGITFEWACFHLFCRSFTAQCLLDSEGKRTKFTCRKSKNCVSECVVEAVHVFFPDLHVNAPPVPLLNKGLGEADGCSDPLGQRPLLQGGVPTVGGLCSEERCLHQSGHR